MKPKCLSVLPEPGEVFEFPYPFVRDTFSLMDEDGLSEGPTWKPGVKQLPVYPDDYEAVAEGIGKQAVTIVGVYKPGRFPVRVFFTRKWVDPDGKVFGKNNCRVASICGFRSLINGYRHEFRLIAFPLPAKTAPVRGLK